jgi:hypothetical protein
MPVLPADIMALFICFALVLSPRVWRYAPPLVVGAILARGQRTIAAVLRALGLGQLITFQTAHRVLNRARLLSRQASEILFRSLVTTIAPHGQLVVGLDETLERRCSRKISAAGIYRDPVRSSRSDFVKARGLRCASIVDRGAPDGGDSTASRSM